jgi:TetR/AcrR family transcriptional regulator
MLLQFAVNNKGMTRILIGEALVHEDARLQTQILSILDRLEMTLKDIYRHDHAFVTRIDCSAQASLLMAYVLGRWHFYVRSGFKRSPLEAWQTQAGYLAV